MIDDADSILDELDSLYNGISDNVWLGGMEPEAGIDEFIRTAMRRHPFMTHCTRWQLERSCKADFIYETAEQRSE